MQKSDDRRDILKVLFVCTGNTCRSPMAEGIFNHKLGSKLASKLRATSAGTIAGGGVPAHEFSFITCQSKGIDIGDHRSSPLTVELVAESDLVLAMENYHVDAVESLGGAGKTYLLTAYPNGKGRKEIPDPIGHDLKFYEKNYAEIERNILRTIAHMEHAYPHILV